MSLFTACSCFALLGRLGFIDRPFCVAEDADLALGMIEWGVKEQNVNCVIETFETQEQ